MGSLEGKITLVTGASRGIGKGIAIGLGEAGATVYITGRSLDSSNVTEGVSGSLRETQLAVEDAGGICIPVMVDHSDDQQVRLLFERIQDEQKGQLDLLVNNAFSGVQALKDGYEKPFWECPENIWDAVNHVGLRSHYIASVFAARLMIQRKQGLICTISSWGGMSYIFGAAYGAGKAACDRLAADMAVELKPYNVTSLSIWPGIVGTEHISSLALQMGEDKPGNQQSRVISQGFNWETPLLTGRVIAALAADPTVMRFTGRVRVVAELADHYGIIDKDGLRPVSLRSLRFIAPMLWPPLIKYASLIPNINIPWFLLLWGTLQSPKI